jgi:hypothetical protein
MIRFGKQQSGWKISLVVLTCLVVGMGLFSWGYWQGQQTLRPASRALALNGNSNANLAQANSGSGQITGPLPQAHAPLNASPEMKEFLENREKLGKAFSDFHSQLASEKPPGFFRDAMQQFRKQNKALIDRQALLAQLISQQQVGNPVTALPPLQIPPSASPEMKTYLTARDRLMRDQMAMLSKHRTDDPAVRQVAMQQWRQQNANRFQQLQQQAQALAQNNLHTTQ